MLKIAIATIFYQCKEEMQRLIDSIPPKVVDTWICVDGPFRYNLDMNPDLSHKSDDGSLAVIYDSAPKFIDSVILHHKPGSTEFDKRNTYLENCQKLGDINVLIIVDSDEMFVYPSGVKPLECWNRFKQNIEIEIIRNRHHNVYGIPYFEEVAATGGEDKWKAVIGTTADTYKPRVWVNPGAMRYINNSHYNFANIYTQQKDIEDFKKNGLTYCQHVAKIIRGGIVLTQDQSLRTKEYQQQRKRYQQYLISLEPLVQTGKSFEEADKLAKEQPSENWDPIP